MTTIDLYSGARGWTLGLQLLGLGDDLGFEIMAEACATSAAAGMPTIRCDLADYPVQQCETLIASPPCQTISAAGSGEGREMLPEIARRAGAGDWHIDDLDDRTRHLLVVGRWMEESGCSTILLEQVPAALPVWQAYARWLRARGWSAWAGKLNAADYGVPQIRRRAFLIASRVRDVGPPRPTHCKGGGSTMFDELRPWVTMAEALGWGMGRVGFPRIDDRGDSPDGYRERDWRGTDEPSFAVTEKARSWMLSPGLAGFDKPNRRLHDAETEPAPTLVFGHDVASWVWELNRRQQKDGVPMRKVPMDETAPTLTTKGAMFQWIFERPATTVAGDHRMWPPGHKVNQGDRDRLGEDEANERYGDRAGTDAIRLSLADALVLQSFPSDHPVQGSQSARFLQCGNAVPPRLAAHVIAAGLGLDPPMA